MAQNKEISLEDDSFKEKILSLQNIVKGYRMTLEGYIWSGDKDSYIFTNKPLCDSRIIDQLVGLLSSYCYNANLITIKDIDTFWMQQYYFAKEVNKILHTSPYANTSTYTQVFLITDDTFQNIGDVILGSKGLVGRAVATEEEEKRMI